MINTKQSGFIVSASGYVLFNHNYTSTQQPIHSGIIFNLIGWILDICWAIKGHNCGSRILNHTIVLDSDILVIMPSSIIILIQKFIIFFLNNVWMIKLLYNNRFTTPFNLIKSNKGKIIMAILIKL